LAVAPSGSLRLSEPHRRGTPLPLSQLVEETRSRASVPNHLLETKIYAKLKSNSQIQADPAELHFTSYNEKMWGNMQVYFLTPILAV
uniref:Uncharacterized protein n=1 Tax=Cyprinodon variegatus TaxID=28743 RepID=A0A3Q2GR55_CYPVA